MATDAEPERLTRLHIALAHVNGALDDCGFAAWEHATDNLLFAREAIEAAIAERAKVAALLTEAQDGLRGAGTILQEARWEGRIAGLRAALAALDGEEA